MSHQPAPYTLYPVAGCTHPAAACPSLTGCSDCPAATASLPTYTLPSPEAQATFSEARLGQECGLWLQNFHATAYGLFFHIPNGGLRTAVESHGFKMQHAKAGVPDYLLAMPAFLEVNPSQSFAYNGLFIELKTRTGRVAPAQTAWHERLRQQGYRVEVVRSLDEFITLLTEYLA